MNENNNNNSNNIYNNNNIAPLKTEFTDKQTGYSGNMTTESQAKQNID